MAQTYELADKSIANGLAEARKRWHPVLEKCGVTVAILAIADVDEETGEVRPTLKKQGYPCAAVIAIASLKHRVLGVADAILTLDAATWSDLDDAARLALLDHELCHLRVRGAERGFVELGEDGRPDRPPRTDDHGRPVLKMRQHDWQLGGFREIAKRHASQSLDVQQVRACRDESGQYFWDFDLEAAVDLLQQGAKLRAVGSGDEAAAGP